MSTYTCMFKRLSDEIFVLLDFAKMGMREGCPIKCIGNYLVEDLFFREKDF